MSPFGLAPRVYGQMTMTDVRYVGFVLAGLVIGGGIVDASSTAPEINACADKTTGMLRLGARCYATENPVSWSAQGPEGPQGPQGSQGPKGPSSARAIKYNGPEEASFVQSPSICGPLGPAPLDMSFELDSKCYWHTAYLGNLGPGEHVLTAKVSVQGTGIAGEAGRVRCALHTEAYLSAPNIIDDAKSDPVDMDGFGWFDHPEIPMTLIGAFENTTWTQHPFYVTCRSYAPFDAEGIKANVVTVDTVTSVQLP